MHVFGQIIYIKIRKYSSAFHNITKNYSVVFRKKEKEAQISGYVLVSNIRYKL